MLTHRLLTYYETRLFAQSVTLLEHINASTCVNQLLLAGKERMALGADFNFDILLC